MWIYLNQTMMIETKSGRPRAWDNDITYFSLNGFFSFVLFPNTDFKFVTFFMFTVHYLYLITASDHSKETRCPLELWSCSRPGLIWSRGLQWGKEYKYLLNHHHFSHLHKEALIGRWDKCANSSIKCEESFIYFPSLLCSCSTENTFL